MEENLRPIILFKAIKDLNVEISVAVEHLRIKGYHIENKPTSKLSQEMYDELQQTFGLRKDQQINKLTQSASPKKVNTVSSTLTYIGKVTKFLDENGYGFVREVESVTNASSIYGEIFFHIKNVLSEATEGGIYAHRVAQSRKHSGKLEATEMVLIKDLKQIEVLFGLHIRYPRHLPLDYVLKAAAELSVDVLFTKLTAICERYIFFCEDRDRYQNMKCFYSLLKLSLRVDIKLKYELTHRILQSAANDVDMALIFGNRYLASKDLEDHCTRIKVLHFTYNANHQASHLPYLTPLCRVTIYNIKNISTDAQVKMLISLLDIPGEDKQANYLSVKSTLSVDRRSTTILWIYDYEPERPELRDLIPSLDKSSIIKMLGKFSFKDFVSEFPYKEISNPAEFEVFSIFFELVVDKKELLLAYIAGGLNFSATYYLMAVSNGYFNGIPWNIDLLKEAVGNDDIAGYKKLITIIGWKNSLKVFECPIQASQHRSLELIINTALDFIKSDTLELNKFVKLDPSTHLILWLDGLIELVDLTSVSAYFLTIKDVAISEKIYSLIKDKKPFLSRAFDVFKKMKKANSVEAATRLLARLSTLDPINYDRFLIKVITASHDNTKLGLWLSDIHDEYDFDCYRPLFITLDREAQINFLKKTVWLLTNNKIQVTLSDLLSLRSLTIDPETANLLGSPGEINISVFIVLQLMQDLQVGALTNPEKIYQLIAENITDVRQLLVIDGFFDKCQGRLGMDYKADVKEKELYPLMEKRSEIPANLKYCEGRKAKLKGTATPAICERTGKEFWWCRNMKCYSNCISSHQNWRDFTILDFCRIFGIPLEQDDYETLLGYINKINRYLKHMNCRSCNHILRPVNRSGGTENGNYGFYRVSNFACLNSECKEHMQIIYLSHCTNGFCGGIIDQRDSVKCIPKEALHANCGWYICNDCLACCNTENINKRKYILKKTAQGYNGHNNGHLDLGQICCPKCGHELQRNGDNSKKYKEILAWLINNRDSSPMITKYGQRKTDGKYWFLLTRDSRENTVEFMARLLGLVSYGFNIPDTSQVKVSYMVSEPFGNNGNSLLFNCTRCDYSLDLASNFEMHAVMRNYHKKLNITKQYV